MVRTGERDLCAGPSPSLGPGGRFAACCVSCVIHNRLTIRAFGAARRLRRRLLREANTQSARCISRMPFAPSPSGSALGHEQRFALRLSQTGFGSRPFGPECARNAQRGGRGTRVIVEFSALRAVCRLRVRTTIKTRYS